MVSTLKIGCEVVVKVKAPLLSQGVASFDFAWNLEKKFARDRPMWLLNLAC